jgi:Na+/H+ antiporter NhaC
MPHPYGWLSLLPSLVAIVLAIATRRVVLSLLAGIVVGALLTCGGNIPSALYDTFFTHLWPSFTSPGKLRIFCFTIVMGAMLGIIQRTGGMHGLVEAITPLARTRRGGQVVTWLTGLVIFFDDYANTLLLGSTFRPLSDRLKISREKLAYVVDSTAAPVAGLALVSTWVAVEIDYVDQGLENLTLAEELKAFDLFVASIPYRFYMIMALFFVPLTALLGREFGPMLKSERLAKAQRDESTSPATRHKASSKPGEIAAGGWYHAVVPIGVTLGMVLLLLYVTGKAALKTDTTAADNPPLHDIFGAADSSFSLLYGALAGIILAIVMAVGSRLLNGRQLVVAAAKGLRIVLPAIAILTVAATLSRMTGNRSVDGKATQDAYEFSDHRLYTGEYLKSLISPGDANHQKSTVSKEPTLSNLSIKMLPTVVFVLASIVAFCTGTSWGTMGILMPMVVTLAHALLTRDGQTVFASNPIMLGSIGGVLAGAVFGDHCSPISDTTVLSSHASGCDHIAHVRTQLPYALTVAMVVIAFGTLPVGWGVSVWFLLPLQLGALVLLLLVIGRKV